MPSYYFLYDAGKSEGSSKIYEAIAKQKLCGEDLMIVYFVLSTNIPKHLHVSISFRIRMKGNQEKKVLDMMLCASPNVTL